MSIVLVRMTEEAHRAIRAQVTSPAGFKLRGVRLPSGEWEVPMERSTLERLQAIAFPGESLSDTIIRAMEFYSSQGRRN